MVAIGMFIVSVGMMSGGRVLFSFFPTPEADIIIANFKMHSGTKRKYYDPFSKNLSCRRGVERTKFEQIVKFKITVNAAKTI